MSLKEDFMKSDLEYYQKRKAKLRERIHYIENQIKLMEIRIKNLKRILK